MSNETDNKYCDKCKVLLTPWESFGPLFMEVTPNIFICISCLKKTGIPEDSGEALIQRRVNNV